MTNDDDDDGDSLRGIFRPDSAQSGPGMFVATISNTCCTVVVIIPSTGRQCRVNEDSMYFCSCCEPTLSDDDDDVPSAHVSALDRERLGYVA